MPGAPIEPSGGSLFQRPKSNGNGTGPVEPETIDAPMAEAEASEVDEIHGRDHAGGARRRVRGRGCRG